MFIIYWSDVYLMKNTYCSDLKTLSGGELNINIPNICPVVKTLYYVTGLQNSKAVGLEQLAMRLSY